MECRLVVLYWHTALSHQFTGIIHWSHGFMYTLRIPGPTPASPPLSLWSSYWGTTISKLSPPQRPISVVGRLKRKKKKARGFPPSHRSPSAFYFLDVFLFLLGYPAGASAAETDITANKGTPYSPRVSFEAGHRTQRPVVWPQRLFLIKDRFDP